MKKKSTIFSIVCLICLILVLCGCQGQTTADEASDTSPSEQEPVVCEAPVEYDSLEDFLNTVKSKKEDMFRSAGRDFYYLPKNLPDGYKLSSVNVLPMYLTIKYKINPSDENELPLVYRWVYTKYGNGNEFAINSIVEEGAIHIDYASNDLLDVYADEDYAANYNSAKEKSGNWPCDYLQEGEYFQARIPWNIEPEKLAEALEMTKVYIK